MPLKEKYTRLRNFLYTVKPVWLLIFGFSIFLSIVGGKAYVNYLQSLQGMLDSNGHVLGRDFTGSWVTVLLLKAGDINAIYSATAYSAKLRAVFDIAGQPWVYPPQYLFLLWPFTFINHYVAAYVAWCVLSVAAYGAAMFWRSPLTASWRFTALVAPGAVISLFMGQNGLFSTALLIGGFRFLATMPCAAGVLFGLLTFKPQLGILIPVILIALRQYKAFGAAAITFAVLVLASGIAFGWQSWAGFFDNTWHMQAEVAQLITNRLISLYAAILMLGLPLQASSLLQAAISILLTAALCLRLSTIRNAHWTDWLRIAMPIMYLATPYLFIYDLCALNAFWLFWLRQQQGRKVSFLASIVWLMLWYMPFFSKSMDPSGTLGYPWTPFLLIAAFAIAWQETKLSNIKANLAHQSANP